MRVFWIFWLSETWEIRGTFSKIHREIFLDFFVFLNQFIRQLQIDTKTPSQKPRKSRKSSQHHKPQTPHYYCYLLKIIMLISIQKIYTKRLQRTQFPILERKKQKNNKVKNKIKINYRKFQFDVFYIKIQP
jgi:hypothetical protein